ncbi:MULTISPECIES: YcbX family protein [unclassified Gilliamella]|uniref:YcbX family protein n=1 Tax=unclassified Gilliamella TaxID=2685620 RepID=UPI00226AFBBF|nr:MULTISPECIES: YcbX family protein [unclassified Gilliamella]MCX8600685.1 YcbX family protein [Gilliamella sp. B3722]MCX8609225.1 YcbX family protein [Gilliamella sp. B3771]MCX8609902.1 YcbX family protein [Gilliamella sp. B3891]MCX8612008.1 YcbX family protein [Gilliamella sp. B3773]MCX8615512.1 YcbX family protein [Gilliamella sp. B3770]
MSAVSQLFIYPIKSLSGIPMNQSETVEGGFNFDRILMISEPDGTFITARQFPELLKLKTAIVNNNIVVSTPYDESITINFDEFSKSNEPTEVWGNHFTSHIAPISVNQFFSQLLHKDVQLRWVGRQLSRRTKRYQDVPVSFADGYPYLLLNEASFNYLQKQCPEKLDIRQFRANIIIKDALPFAEDGWKTIKIGEVIFDIVKPCTRCVLTTINVNSAKPLANNEPLNTLRYFRSDDQGQIDFGMNMIARNQGTVSIGDKIEVLERQPAKNYIKNFPKESIKDYQPCTITFQDKKIKGNNQQTILEQLEQHNISIPNSCRAGVCGRCSVLLTKGNVKPLTQSAIKQNKHILACSCVPKGDITIE